jgi:hypothetical protein
VPRREGKGAEEDEDKSAWRNKKSKNADGRKKDALLNPDKRVVNKGIGSVRVRPRLSEPPLLSVECVLGRSEGGVEVSSVNDEEVSSDLEGREGRRGKVSSGAAAIEGIRQVECLTWPNPNEVTHPACRETCWMALEGKKRWVFFLRRISTLSSVWLAGTSAD